MLRKGLFPIFIDRVVYIKYVCICSQDSLKLGFRCTQRLEVRILDKVYLDVDSAGETVVDEEGISLGSSPAGPATLLIRRMEED